MKIYNVTHCPVCYGYFDRKRSTYKTCPLCGQDISREYQGDSQMWSPTCEGREKWLKKKFNV